MSIATQDAVCTDPLDGGVNEFIDIIQRRDYPTADDRGATPPRPHGILGFVTELQRRRVCRAATMYAVVMWLVCQVVELVYPELGMPEWTLKFVIIVGLLGFPIALIVSWLIQITPEGLVIDGADGAGVAANTDSGLRRPVDRLIDCSLVVAALAIGVQLAVGVVAAEPEIADENSRRVVVLPFRVASGDDAEALSEGLVIELQHQLSKQTGMTVIAPRSTDSVTECLRLTGAVYVGEKFTRVTVTVVDAETDVVEWSEVFHLPTTDTFDASVDFAQEIVATLPRAYKVSGSVPVANAS